MAMMMRWGSRTRVVGSGIAKQLAFAPATPVANTIVCRGFCDAVAEEKEEGPKRIMPTNPEFVEERKIYNEEVRNLRLKFIRQQEYLAKRKADEKRRLREEIEAKKAINQAAKAERKENIRIAVEAMREKQREETRVESERRERVRDERNAQQNMHAANLVSKLSVDSAQWNTGFIQKSNFLADRLKLADASKRPTRSTLDKYSNVGNKTGSEASKVDDVDVRIQESLDNLDSVLVGMSSRKH